MLAACNDVCCVFLCDQGDLLNEVGSGVGQWVQQQAEELSKLQQGAADVLGGVVQKAGDSIKSGKLVSMSLMADSSSRQITAPFSSSYGV